MRPPRTHLAALVVWMTVSLGAHAQVPEAKPRVAGAVVSGVVRDSIARGPLAGAWVQLVATDGSLPARTAVADSVGRFSFDDVPDGDYALGFFHPMVDSLGIEAPLRALVVWRRRAPRADLAIPSVATVRAAVCGAASAATAGALVVGTVRDARTRAPAAGATVTGEWLEVSLGRGVYDRRRPRIAVTAAASGWFAMCDVPKGGTMFLGAQRGMDNSDLVELSVPADGFVRRDLYIGPQRTSMLAATAADTSLAVHQRGGDGRLRGRVVTVDGNHPVGGALVRIIDGPIVVANPIGEWSLAEAPPGSRVLEVRAVGFYPARRAVDVIADAPPVTIAMSTFKAMLDTVKVTAARVAARLNSGFEQRQRAGIGNYLTAKDIARHGAMYASDVFRVMRGVKVGYAYDTLPPDMPQLFDAGLMGNTDRRILMRGMLGTWCTPLIYLNGADQSELNADEVDHLVRVEQISAIEVYSEVSIPPAFQRPRTGCGAILFWTK